MKACCHLIYMNRCHSVIIVGFFHLEHSQTFSNYNISLPFCVTDKFRKAFWMDIRQHHRLNFIKKKKSQSVLNHQGNKIQHHLHHKTKRTWLKWKMTSTPRHFFCHYWQLKRFVKSKGCRFINNFLSLKRYHLIKCFNLFFLWQIR